MKTNLPKRLRRASVYMVLTFGIYLALPFMAIALDNSALYVVGVPLLDCCGCMAVGYFYGRKNGRDPLMPAASAILFIPIMFMFYNSTAWVYIILMALFSFLGECVGCMFQGKFGR